MVNSLHREEGPRQRDDGRAERVRVGRERPRRCPRRARLLDGLSLARLRQGHDRGALGPRKRSDRAPPGLLPELLPARQRRSRSSLERSTRRRLWLSFTRLRPDREARPDAVPDVHRSTRRRTANGRSRFAASVTSRSWPPRTTSPPGAHPDAPGLDLLAFALARHAFRPPSQGPRRDEEGIVRLQTSSPPVKEPGLLLLRRRGPAGPVARRGEGRSSSRSSDAAAAPAHEGGGRARAQAQLAQADRPRRSTTLPRSGCALSNWIAKGDWRLFFLYRDRLKSYPVEGRREGCGRVSQALEPHGRAFRPHGEAGPFRGAAADRRRRDGEGLHGRRRRLRGRGVRPVARERRDAHEARDARVRHEDRAPSEEDAWRLGAGDDHPSLPRREVPHGTRTPSPISRPTCSSAGPQRRRASRSRTRSTSLKARIRISGGTGTVASVDRDDEGEPPEGPRPRRRDPQGAVLPRVRARDPAAGEPREPSTR